MVLEAKNPDMSIKAKRPPISPPFNLSKFDLIKRIDKKTIVAFREEIFKKINGLKGGLIGGLFALILISGIFASSTIALGSLFYAYRLKKKSNLDDNQMQDLETVNV